MLKSEAVFIAERVAEDLGAEFSQEQIEAVAIITMRVAGRLLEEAVASWNPNIQGSKPTFYTE